MPRYDKYDGKTGGFRAPLAAAVSATDAYTPYGVGVNASGQVVLGAGNTGVVAVMIAHGAKNAGDVVDCMTDGEIVEFDGDPGTVYGAAADGTVAADGATRVGFTVEADRLVVRMDRNVTAGGASV